jgi:hypothetical protein
MKAWQFKNPVTHERFTITDTQMTDFNFNDKDGFCEWARKRGYELVKTFELDETEEQTCLKE